VRKPNFCRNHVTVITKCPYSVGNNHKLGWEKISHSTGDNGELTAWRNQQTLGDEPASGDERGVAPTVLGRTNSAPHLGLTAFKLLLIFLLNEIDCLRLMLLYV
jgi:hypothetical protein